MNGPQPEIKIEIDDTTARGTYTNLAFITHSETEFIMDFTFLQPQAAKTKVLARLVSSPVHAKRLLWALKDNIEKFEARFGPIAEGGGPVPKPSDVYQ